MGYSTEAIFIKEQLTDEMIKKITKITHGDSDLVFNRDVSFDGISSGPGPGIFFGQMNDSFYMIYDWMGYNLHDKSYGDIEGVFTHLFPESEILYIVNVESANAYTYHLIKNGKTIRKKVGAHPDVAVDIGEELETEKAYYVKKEVRDGQEIYYTKSHFKEGELDEWTHDQVGGSIAFQLVRDMTGCRLMTSDTDDFKAKQYFLKTDIEEMNKFLDGELEESVPELRKGLPVNVIHELIESAKPILLENGFLENQKGEFVRKKDQLNQLINFHFDHSAKAFSHFNYSFSQNIGYREWHIQQFGNDMNGAGQRVFDSVQLNFQKLGITDKHQTLFLNGDKTKKELREGIIERLKDVIIPAFDKSSIEDITANLKGIRKADYHLMNNELEAARVELENLKEALVSSSVKNKFDDEKLERYFKWLEQRNKFFDEPVEYRTYYSANVDRITKEVEAEKKKLKAEQEARRKEEEQRKQEELKLEKERAARIQEENEKSAKTLQGSYERAANKLGHAKLAIINEYGALSREEVEQIYSNLSSLPKSKRPSDYNLRIEMLSTLGQGYNIKDAHTWTSEKRNQSTPTTALIILVIILLFILFIAFK